MFQNPNALKTTSTPTFSEFDPTIIPFQDDVVDDILCQYDYKQGTHEILLSGSIGSAKSVLAAHLIVRQCLDYPGNRILIGRRALPQLRETIYRKICEHIDQETLKEGRDYWKQDNTCSIQFRNKSEIIAGTWADKKYRKFASTEVSCVFIEEGTENNEEDRQVYLELLQRCGRLGHVPTKWLMVATNPDSPSHWLYKRYFTEKDPLRHVFLSKTSDNPFLPPEYIEGLKRNLDPKLVRRMLYGEWLDIFGETVYHQYDPALHNIDKDYEIDRLLPIHMSWDFNIGEGKPLSTVFYQIRDGAFHFFDEIVIEGARTESVLEDAANRGLFEHPTTFLLHGDATGKRRQTSSNHSDWEIIQQFLTRHTCNDGRRLRFTLEVPTKNPLVRERHNTVNAYLKNGLGEVRAFFYPKCKVAREGMALTKLKKGADYVEDDTKHYQHITTAIGYGICWHHIYATRKRSEMIQQ